MCVARFIRLRYTHGQHRIYTTAVRGTASMIQRIALFICLPFILHASITEVHHMREIFSHIQQITREYAPNEVCIFFDLDNTLIMPTGNVGSDQWATHMIEQKIQEGYSIHDAYNLVLPIYWHTQHYLMPTCVEEDTASIVKALQEQNFVVVGLTARSYCMSERTLQQLRENNLLFSCSLAPRELSFNLSYPVVYKDGVMFIGSHDKGAIALHFLDAINFKPSAVIFVDDKLRYVEAVENAMKTRNITYYGFRYSFCDHLVHAFNPEIAAAEHAALMNCNPACS